MLSLEHFRDRLGPELSDDQLREIRAHLYQFAELAIFEYRETRRDEGRKKRAPKDKVP